MRKKGIIPLLAALFSIAMTAYIAIIAFLDGLKFNLFVILLILLLSFAVYTSVKLTIMAVKLLRQK